MPEHRYIAAVASAIVVPAGCGASPGYPVLAMNPDMPCATMSAPGASWSSPSGPYDEKTP